MGVVADAVHSCQGSAGVVVAEDTVFELPFELSASECLRMRDASSKRRREFAAGRHLAALACQGLGQGRPALPPDRRGAPQWPAGAVGSITHCDSWAAAAVAESGVVLAIGIDVEPASPLPAGLDRLVFAPSEHRTLTVGHSWAIPDDRVLFSVKEAIYKAWHPLTGMWLDFTDVLVDLRQDGTWTAEGGRGDEAFRWDGGWSARSDLIAAAVVVRP